MRKLYVAGFGPGGYEHMTAKCIQVIEEADVVTGYTTYVNILKEYFPDKKYLATPMMQEVKRCRMAVEEAVRIRLWSWSAPVTAVSMEWPALSIRWQRKWERISR